LVPTKKDRKKAKELAAHSGCFKVMDGLVLLLIDYPIWRVNLILLTQCLFVRLVSA